MSWDWLVPFSSYTEFWRQARKLLDRGLRPGAAATYRPMQQARARLLLTRMLTSPDKWEDHIELFVKTHSHCGYIYPITFPDLLAYRER